MPPKRNKQSKASGRNAAQLVPYSVPMIPPAAPPMVAANPKRKVVLDLDTTVTAGGGVAINAATIRTELSNQLGGVTVANLHFVLHSIATWAPATPGASSIVCTDQTFGTQVSGDGTVTTRARCGVKFPKNVAPHYGPTDVTTVWLGTVSPATGDATHRLHLTYWT